MVTVQYLIWYVSTVALASEHIALDSVVMLDLIQPYIWTTRSWKGPFVQFLSLFFPGWVVLSYIIIFVKSAHTRGSTVLQKASFVTFLGVEGRVPALNVPSDDCSSRKCNSSW